MRRRRADRWLKLADVAELMQLKQARKKDRRMFVWRMIRRLEARDGTQYMRRFGNGSTSPLWISLTAIEKLMPWEPGTVSAIRSDVNELGTRMKRAERKIVGHDRELSNHREWQRKAAELLTSMVK